MIKFWTVIIQKVSFFLDNPNFLKMPFYAVAKGRIPGIFMSWPDCEAQVKGFSGARYKKFDTIVHAQEFININGSGSTNQKKQTKNYKGNNIVSSNDHIKRSYATTSANGNTSGYKPNQSKTKPAASNQLENHESENDSDEFPASDDLNNILTKQLDDVEKRLKGFEKNIDTIIKKSRKNSNRQAILIEPPQPKKKKVSGNVEFEEDHEGFVSVYTDGACSANGRTGARAGIGVYWGNGHPLNISEPVSGRATNNCGEIQAATKAIKVALQNNVKKLSINTDSKFLINSVTKWMPGWKRKGWKLQSGEPVKNEKDFKDLDSVQNKLNIKWNYVEAHQGIHGNEMADRLAKEGATMYNSK